MNDKKHIQKFNEHISDISDSNIDKLKSIVNELPKMRWNISEDDGYFGDEWDNWEHMDEKERYEYFGKIFSCVKKLKDTIESL